MDSPLRFLLFLRKLTSLFRNLWDRSIRRLWYIYALVRSRILSQNLEKKDEIHRSAGPRPAKPTTRVISASRLPPPPSPTGGDGPIYGTHKNHGDGNLGVDGNLPEESRPSLRPPSSVSPHVVLSPRREVASRHPPDPLHSVLNPH